MKSRSCIIDGAFCESVKVHLTQTPVWNAFWVTCCLALVSVILKSSKDRALVDLSGRFMGCQCLPPSPAVSLLLLLWRSWMGVMILRADSRPGLCVLDGPAAGVSQPLGAAGSSLGRRFGRWYLEFSLSLRKNRERGEKTLYGINWLVCVSILTRLPPKTISY